jgi:predicted esterase
MRIRSMVFAILLVALMASVSFFAVANAAAPTITNITGKLGGADFLIQKPSNWKGDLIVYCHGFSHLEPTPAYLVTQATGMAALCNQGFMVALSTYGTGGMCIKEGTIRTHQLTEWIINNYAVTGHVYLIGASMGGNIALQLGAKYPELYDGVLDMFGSKNMIQQYNDKLFYVNTADDAELAQAVLDRDGLVPPLIVPTIADFRKFCQVSLDDIILACGGTPTEKPMAYQRVSPVYSATDITIPTITIHGTKDALVPYITAVEFMNAVNEAGHSDMYRLYKVPNGQHGDAVLRAAVPGAFQTLEQWVVNGVKPGPSIP